MYMYALTQFIELLGQLLHFAHEVIGVELSCVQKKIGKGYICQVQVHVLDGWK